MNGSVVRMCEVACPRCGRKRSVSVDTRAARMTSREARDDVENALWCKTCRLLRSRDQHVDAIRHLERQIADRRLRGL